MRLDHLLSGKHKVSQIKRPHLSVVGKQVANGCGAKLQVASDRLGSVAQLVRAPS